MNTIAQQAVEEYKAKERAKLIKRMSALGKLSAIKNKGKKDFSAMAKKRWLKSVDK